MNEKQKTMLAVAFFVAVMVVLYLKLPKQGI